MPAAVMTMKQLLEAGVHFGHQTRRWNPKMRRFIFGERNGIYIIDLEQSLASVEKAYHFVRDTVTFGGTVLFVGTKKQAQGPIAAEATRANMPYVNQRWLGGMLTNFQTMSRRLARLRELEALETAEAQAVLPKKEILKLGKEKDTLAKNLGGIRNMTKLPSAIWVVDTRKEHIAVKEARKIGIPVVAVIDTNCDPDEVDYPIPGNDDAIRAIGLLSKMIADACVEGQSGRTPSGESTEQELVAAAEPLAEWELAIMAEEEAEKVKRETEEEERRRLR